MTLILQEPCKTCDETGIVQSPAWKEWYAANPGWNTLAHIPATEEPTEPEELWCVECEGSGKVLTEDGKAVAALIGSILTARENYMGGAAMRREEAASRRERSRNQEMDDLRRTIEQERWAREDLEKKLARR